MFIDFFYALRAHGLKVSLTEWLTLMEALSTGLAGTSLVGFYHLCRALCVKHEAHFDLYDQIFAAYFRDAAPPPLALDHLMDWLKDPALPRALTDAELEQLKALDLEEVRRMFYERLQEQDARHDGGNRWIGTGGTSPFGHGGQHPSGIRVGGEGGGRSAMQVAQARRFRDLRSDLTLDVRQISVALRQLRRLTRDGRPDELDLDGTIDQTARNAGDIELVFRPERKNTIRLLLLMDVGGSMTPYSRLTSRLFSAAHAANHFKAFKHYYFHNCPYDTLFTSMARYEGEPTGKVLADLSREWFCVIVGDAAMHPYELSQANGAIYLEERHSVSGLEWLTRIRERFPRSVWLNPDPPRYWSVTHSTQIIRNVFDMFPLTVKGLEDSITHLRQVPL